MQYDKRALYTRLEDKLSSSDLRFEFPIDVRELIRREDIEVQYCPFESDAIGAVLVKGEQKSGILVNYNKPAAEQRFDLAHELIHFWFHPTRTSFSFQNPQSRDRDKEWKTNEGAAQLLLPYTDFIPRFVKTARYVEENYEPPEEIYNSLARFYNVLPIVVDYRARNLESEILQYLDGAPIDRVVLNHFSVRFDKTKPPKLFKTLIQKIH